MVNLWPKNNQDTRNNNQTKTNNQIPIINSRIGYWSLGFGICLYLVSWLLVICLNGCGEIDEEVKSLTISPSSATVGINQSQLFTVTGKDDLGRIVQVVPTWSVEGGIGTVSSSGLFNAGSATGEGFVKASYGGINASAKVTITDKGWLVGRIQSIISSGFVPGIKVYLKENATLSDFSDSSGLYSISGIPAGTYEALTEQTVLYLAASREVVITSGGTTTWNVYLETRPGVSIVPTTTVPSF